MQKIHLSPSFRRCLAVLCKGKTAPEAFLDCDGVAVRDHLLRQRLVWFPLVVVLVPHSEQFCRLLIPIHARLPHLMRATFEFSFFLNPKQIQSKSPCEQFCLRRATFATPQHLPPPSLRPSSPQISLWNRPESLQIQVTNLCHLQH